MWLLLFLWVVFWLNPRRMLFVIVVSAVVVKWCFLNPCWCGESGISGVITVLIRCSMTFAIGLRSEIGRYDVELFAGLFRFEDCYYN